MSSFDIKNLLLLGAGSSFLAAIGLYVAYLKHYQESMICYTESPGVASTQKCTKNVTGTHVQPAIGLTESKQVCEQNDEIMGMDWNPEGCKFYQRDSGTGSTNDAVAPHKCQKVLNQTQGQGSYIACIKTPDRKRSYFISAIVMASVAAVMILVWVFISQQK